MDNELLGELLTYIISDPSDVVFLRGIREGISYIQPQDMTPEVKILDRFIFFRYSIVRICKKSKLY